MDTSRFDAISRLVGRAASRRSALLAALGAIGGISAIAAAAPSEARKRDGGHSRRRRPRPAGPCGDGSRKDNICTKNRQCCTRYCEKSVTNKDKRGRCRCIRRGQPCKPDQVCCNTQCLKGVCGVGIATGKACAPDDSCADPAAICRAYGEYEPTGTYCLLTNGEVCAANDNCVSSNCDAGICKPLVCDVCASGCAYNDISAALAAAADGSIVRVDSGTWTVTGSNGKITDGRTVTVRACNGKDDVIVTSSGWSTFSVGEISKGPISASGRWILEGLTITNTGNNQNGYAVGAAVMAPDTGGILARRCTISSTTAWGVAIQGDNPSLVIEDSSIVLQDGWVGVLTQQWGGGPAQFTRTTVTGGSSGALFRGEGTHAVFTDCILSGNTTTGNGAVWLTPYFGFSSSVVLAGTTTITGNTAAIGGTGGIHVQALSAGQIELTIEPTASVTGNVGLSDGAGLLLSVIGANTEFTLIGGDRIFGNIGGSACGTTPDGVPPYTVTAVPCVF